MVPLVKVNNSTGSVFLESLLVIQFLVVSLFIVLLVSYMGFARFWIKHSLYQGLLCLATEEPVHKCQGKMQKRLKRLLPFGEIISANLKTHNYTVKGKIKWKLDTNLGQSLKLKRFSFTEQQSLRKDRLILPRSRIKKVFL